MGRPANNPENNDTRRLADRELDVLNVLWSSNEEMTSTDICYGKRGLTQSTVIAVLRNLLKDELVEVSGVTHSGKVLSRTYRPTEKSKEFILADFTERYKSFSSVIAPSEVCKSILDIEDTPEKLKEEISKLKKIVSQLEKK